MGLLDVLLGRTHPPMIGLDISSSSVKLVELSQNANGEYVLERFATEPFEKGWITDGQIEKFDEVADAVRRVVTRSGSRTRQAALAMPQSAVITKKIMLPAGLREEELELQVEAEANQYIPFALDEVNLDFQVIGRAPSGLDEVEVLVPGSGASAAAPAPAVTTAKFASPAITCVAMTSTTQLVDGVPTVSV